MVPVSTAGPIDSEVAVSRSLELAGTDLCLAVGARSGTTYSPADRWRPLYVDDCATVDAARSRWQLVTPAD